MDPERLRIEIAEDGGADLSIEGPCAGARYGAHYVRWPDGTRGVLSWQPEIPVAQVGVVLAALDDRGYPVPAYEMAKEFEGGVILVQSRLPGKPPTGIDQSLLKGILAVNELQHHALSDRAEVRGIPLYLTEDGPGYCLHESLQRHPRSARASLAGSAKWRQRCPLICRELMQYTAIFIPRTSWWRILALPVLWIGPARVAETGISTSSRCGFPCMAAGWTVRLSQLWTSISSRRPRIRFVRPGLT